MKLVLLRLLPRAALLLPSLFICGCATFPHVGHMESNIEDASNYESFIMMPIPNAESDPAKFAVLGDGAIPLLAVKQSFEERGLQYTGFEEADLLVGLRAAYIEAETAEFTGDGLADLKHTYPGIKSHRITNGEVEDTASNVFDAPESWVMIVEVFRKDPLQLVWSGWCTSSNRHFFEQDENKLEALQRILAEFPR